MKDVIETLVSIEMKQFMSKTMLCKIHKGILSLEKKRKMTRVLMA